MRRSHEVRARHAQQYALDALHALPCGCVAAIYRTQAPELAVVSLEARGPHCRYAQHQAGRVLELGAQDESRPGR